MSHTIIYNRLFIKATDEDNVDYYCPMLLTGSNNCTQISQKISIRASQKSKVTFSPSQIVSFPSQTDNKRNKTANTKIKYKNLFLIISFNVLSAIFHIIKKDKK